MFSPMLPYVSQVFVCNSSVTRERPAQDTNRDPYVTLFAFVFLEYRADGAGDVALVLLRMHKRCWGCSTRRLLSAGFRQPKPNIKPPILNSPHIFPNNKPASGFPICCYSSVDCRGTARASLSLAQEIQSGRPSESPISKRSRLAKRLTRCTMPWLPPGTNVAATRKGATVAAAAATGAPLASAVATAATGADAATGATRAPGSSGSVCSAPPLRAFDSEGCALRPERGGASRRSCQARVDPPQI